MKQIFLKTESTGPIPFRTWAQAISFIALPLFSGLATGSAGEETKGTLQNAERQAFELVVSRVDGLVDDLDPAALAIVRAHAQRTRRRLDRIETRQEALLRRFDGSAGPLDVSAGAPSSTPAPALAQPPQPQALPQPKPAEPDRSTSTPTSSDGTTTKPARRPLEREERTALVSEAVRAFGASLDEAGRKHDLEARFLLCVMNVESAFRPEAVSKAGAVGLLQLMPATAAELGANPWDIRQNIFAGAELIDAHLKRYGEDVALAMAAYNAGPGAVDKHKGVPPYQETREYVARITRECGAPRPWTAVAGAGKPENDRGTR